MAGSESFWTRLSRNCRETATAERRSGIMRLLLLPLIPLLLLLLLVACTTSSTPIPDITPDIIGKTTAPMKIRLSTSSRPALGAVLDLLCEVTPEVDASNLGITLTLPTQLEVISGQTTWRGNVAANETVSISLQVRVAGEGRFDARAYTYFKTSVVGHGAGAELYFLVRGERGWAGNAPPVNHWVGNRISPTGRMIDAASNPVQARAYLTEPLAWGRQTEIVLEVTSTAHMEDAQIGFIVPSVGLEIIDRQVSPMSSFTADTRSERGDGDRQHDIFWEGALEAGETVSVTLKLRPQLTGEGRVYAYVTDLRATGPVLLFSERLAVEAYDPDLAE